MNGELDTRLLRLKAELDDHARIARHLGLDFERPIQSLGDAYPGNAIAWVGNWIISAPAVGSGRSRDTARVPRAPSVPPRNGSQIIGAQPCPLLNEDGKAAEACLAHGIVGMPGCRLQHHLTID
jgi:hypothetical protein